MNARIKSLFFCLLLNTTVAFLQAQDEPIAKKKSTWLSDFSLGGGLQRVHDAGMSPLTYRSAAARLQLGVILERTKALEIFTLAGDAAQLQNSFKASTSQVLSLRYDMDYAFLTKHKNIINLPQTTILIGGSINHTLNVREHNRYGNNALNYDGLLSLQLSAGLQNEFQLFKLPLQLFYRVDLPLISRFWRPFYATSIPREHLDLAEDPTFSALWNSGNWGLTNRVFRIKSVLEIQYLLTNGNRIKLGYTWDYYQINDLHRVKAGMSQITLGLLFNFTGNEKS
mgnify:CR=1 FL=1